MLIPIANAQCETFLIEWIEKVAQLPHRHNIDAWLTVAENAACNAAISEDIIIEMPARATATGRPETVTLPKSCFDYLATAE